MALGARIRAAFGTYEPQILHLARYGSGSVLCAVVSNTVLIVCDMRHYPLVVGVMLSLLGGSSTGYLWHTNVSFKTSASSRSFLQFMGGAIIGLPFAWALLWLFRECWVWPMWLAGLTTTIILFAYHYCNAFLAMSGNRIRSILSRR
ncbi:MAG: GtrA family protein [Novosphingobium sp.]|uniref:GtrA family protein n=1 Tax=Novosphingobium sp. TaxID=1874826 RepID=UPI003B9D3735